MRHPVPHVARPQWPRREPWQVESPRSSRSYQDSTATVVDVWAVSLDRPPIPLLDLARTLSPDEAARAARFRFDIHRSRFTAGRGLLRTLLGALLDESAEALEFRYGEKGKPELVLDEGSPAISFNLTHSADLALIAVTDGRELGVDVEALRPLDDAEALAERFFAVPERKVFRSLPGDRKLDGFYRYWTRKEAYVKARGDGLSLPTTAFAVDFAADRDARLIAFDEEPDELDRWVFEGLDPAPGFTGALAVHTPRRDPETEDPTGDQPDDQHSDKSPILVKTWSW